jgi:hypothetical protein
MTERIIQRPTVGRHVLYTPTAAERDEWAGNPIAPGEQLPAVIVAVWSDECVNLRVLQDGPDVPWVTSVPLGTGEYTWQWPDIPLGATLDTTLDTDESE